TSPPAQAKPQVGASTEHIFLVRPRLCRLSAEWQRCSGQSQPPYPPSGQHESFPGAGSDIRLPRMSEASALLTSVPASLHVAEPSRIRPERKEPLPDHSFRC